MAGISKPYLIFDFDGTLANSLKTGVEIFNELAENHGLDKLGVEDLRELRNLNSRAILQRLGVSTVTAVRIVNQIRKGLHLRMHEIEMISGTREAILELHRKGFPMGILSSNSSENIRGFLARFDLLECFHFIETGVSLFGKSQRILRVMKKCRIDPASVIYVGDETRDMEAARSSRVGSLAVCWGANGREALESEAPDFCIDHPSELLDCATAFESQL